MPGIGFNKPIKVLLFTFVFSCLAGSLHAEVDLGNLTYIGQGSCNRAYLVENRGLFSRDSVMVARRPRSQFAPHLQATRVAPNQDLIAHTLADLTHQIYRDIKLPEGKRLRLVDAQHKTYNKKGFVLTPFREGIALSDLLEPGFIEMRFPQHHQETIKLQAAKLDRDTRWLNSEIDRWLGRHFPRAHVPHALMSNGATDFRGRFQTAGRRWQLMKVYKINSEIEGIPDSWAHNLNVKFKYPLNGGPPTAEGSMIDPLGLFPRTDPDAVARINGGNRQLVGPPRTASLPRTASVPRVFSVNPFLALGDHILEDTYAASPDSVKRLVAPPLQKVDSLLDPKNIPFPIITFARYNEHFLRFEMGTLDKSRGFHFFATRAEMAADYLHGIIGAGLGKESNFSCLP